jgi:hypothetical protein
MKMKSRLAALLACALGCGTAGPLLKVEGPVTATAEAVTERGVDRLPSLYTVRILNLLGAGEGICEVNVRKTTEATWSGNQIVRPDTCYYPNEVAVIFLPTGGYWIVRVKTNAGKVADLTLRLTDLKTEARIRPPSN